MQHIDTSLKLIRPFEIAAEFVHGLPVQSGIAGATLLGPKVVSDVFRIAENTGKLTQLIHLYLL